MSLTPLGSVPAGEKRGRNGLLDYDSSAGRTSVAASSVGATDSDDGCRMEEATFDPSDFQLASYVDPTSPMHTSVHTTTTSMDGCEASVSPAISGVAIIDSRASVLAVNGALYNNSVQELDSVNDGDDLGVLPPLEEQIRLVKIVLDNKELSNRRVGQRRFIISKSWMQRWHEYVDWNGRRSRQHLVGLSLVEPPGPITNEDVLLADGVTLRKYCRVTDVPEEMWNLLAGWYGGNPIERPVIDQLGIPEVELHFLKLKLNRKGQRDAVEVSVSKDSTVGELKSKGMEALLMGPPEDCVGLRVFMTSTYIKKKELKSDSSVLRDVDGLSDDESIQFELPGDIETETDADLFSSDYTSKWRSSYTSSYRRPGTPGAVGLNNLGNTCFMNAAIQCLSHLPQFVRYFAGKDGSGRQPFLEDLNVENPLGTKGELARAFGDLVRGMWEGRERCIYPREFRNVLCDHAQQFLGYEQHDSQEFLAYLLDGIHEDVNRVRDKPYVEKVEASSGECDETAAQRAWEAHLRRNDSFVVDTMHGQYKSVVTCPKAGCGKTSTTFDPAMYLSVPLPVVAEQNVEIILATLDGCRPKRWGLLVSKAAKVKELRRALSKASTVREDRLVFGDIWQHRFHAVFEDHQSVSSLRMEAVMAFELPHWPPPPPMPPLRPATTPSEHGRINGGAEDEGGVRGQAAEGASARMTWQTELARFVIITELSRAMRDAGDPGGRSRLLLRAQAYLDQFPGTEEVAELESRERETSTKADETLPDRNEKISELRHVLREASNYRCYIFAELQTAKDLESFRAAVQSLRAVVEHEQQEVVVQIIQHHSRGLGPYNRASSYDRSTPFSSPVLVSYLPHSTTVREFRNTLAVLFRRLVLPRNTTRQAGREENGMELDETFAEGGGGRDAVGDRNDAAASPRAGDDPDTETGRKGGEPGAGDPENVTRLFRSGELGLFLMNSSHLDNGDRNILGGGGDADNDLVSKWLDEDAPGRMTRLSLRWSVAARREAYDADEVQQVVDDPSVEYCRTRVSETLSMNQCLRQFLEREQLDETEMWYCSSCKEHRRAYKELSLWRLPPVLVIHLKRFSYDTYGGWAASREKIDGLVTFPRRGLDLGDLERVSQSGRRPPRVRTGHEGPTNGTVSSLCATGDEDCSMDDWVVINRQAQPARATARAPECVEASTSGEGKEDPSLAAGLQEVARPAVYDLWGVVNHHGGLNGGHYTAFALNERDSRWYEFSDEHVSMVKDEDNLETAAAYVLFYRRRGTEPTEGAATSYAMDMGHVIDGASVTT